MADVTVPDLHELSMKFELLHASWADWCEHAAWSAMPHMNAHDLGTNGSVHDWYKWLLWPLLQVGNAERFVYDSPSRLFGMAENRNSHTLAQE